jgi:hypothetical protein
LRRSRCSRTAAASARGTFSAGTTNATATLNPEVGAFTVGAGSVTGRNATFLSRVNADASGNKATPVGYDIPASATVTLGTIALIGGSGANLIAHDQPTVTTTVGGSKTVTITGDLSVKSRVYQHAEVDGAALTIALVGGVGVIDPTATVGGTITTGFNGTVTSANTVTVSAFVDASSKAIAAGQYYALGAAAGDATTTASTSPSVTTSVGGSITASGNVLVESKVTTAADSHASGINIALVGALGILTATADDDTSVTTSVTGSITSTTGNVTVRALHNYDPTSGQFLTTKLSTAAVESVSASLLLSVSTATVTATATRPSPRRRAQARRLPRQAAPSRSRRAPRTSRRRAHAP